MRSRRSSTCSATLPSTSLRPITISVTQFNDRITKWAYIKINVCALHRETPVRRGAVEPPAGAGSKVPVKCFGAQNVSV